MLFEIIVYTEVERPKDDGSDEEINASSIDSSHSFCLIDVFDDFHYPFAHDVIVHSGAGKFKRVYESYCAGPSN